MTDNGNGARVVPADTSAPLMAPTMWMPGSGPGRGENDPRNASVAMRAIEADLGALIRAATKVVEGHVRSCQATVILAEAKVRKRAAETHGGLGNAWLWFADPDVLDLAKALRKIAGAP